MQSQSSDPRGTFDSETNISSLGDTPTSRPEAADATGPYASDRAAGASMRRASDDADQVGRMTADADDAEPHPHQKPESKAGAALKAGKSYAESAVNSAGRKMEDVKHQAAELKQRGMQYVADEPWKAAACAAAAGGVLTAMLMSWARGRR